MARTIAIGVQDFAKLRESGSYYSYGHLASVITMRTITMPSSPASSPEAGDVPGYLSDLCRGEGCVIQECAGVR